MSFSSIDWSSAADRLESDGRVQVLDALEESFAKQIATELYANHDWDYALTTRKGPISIRAHEWQSMSPPAKASQIESLRRQARHGFSFAYSRRDVVPLQESEPFVTTFADFIGEERFLQHMRTLCRDGDLTRADAHAAMFQPGSFLKRHDDTYAGKERRYAYVFNFSKEWHSDWGGLLHFPDGADTQAACLVPRFNSLALFRVPQDHFVSQVATYALESRYSITGWLFAD